MKLTNIYVKNNKSQFLSKNISSSDSNEYLSVAFSEKETVKTLGAKWDSVQKQWFVSKNCDLKIFERWYPYSENANMRSNGFYIIKSKNNCWKCKDFSDVYSFALSESELIDDDLKFSKNEGPIICSSVLTIPKSVHELIKDSLPNYFYDYSKTINSYYWMNHCSKCKAAMGDFYMYKEPNGAFYPMTDEPYDYMRITYFQKSFAAVCSYDELIYLQDIKSEGT